VSRVTKLQKQYRRERAAHRARRQRSYWAFGGEYLHYAPLGSSPGEEVLEASRRFTRAEVCRHYGIGTLFVGSPPVRVGTITDISFDMSEPTPKETT
jgi:hypothetical protein